MIWALLVGLVVGAIAKFLMPGKDGGGIFTTMILGVLGSMVAYWIGRAMGFYAEGQPVGFISSVIGAMIVLGVFRMIRGK